MQRHISYKADIMSHMSHAGVSHDVHVQCLLAVIGASKGHDSVHALC